MNLLIYQQFIISTWLQETYFSRVALKFKWLKTVILITPEEQLKIISRFPFQY